MKQWLEIADRHYRCWWYSLSFENGVNALVVPERNHKQLAAAITKLALDCKLRTSIIRAASQTLDSVLQNMDSDQIAKLLSSTASISLLISDETY